MRPGSVVVVPCLAALVLAFGASMGCAATIAFVAPDTGIPAGPMCCEPPASLQGARVCKLTNDGTHRLGQVDDDQRLWWWNDAVAPGKTVEYAVSSASENAKPKAVNIEQTSPETIAVTLNGKPFTTLNFKKNEPRVYLYPVIGPTEVGVTRDHIMRDNPLEKDNRRQDHPHHRSLWTAYGDVRIKDFDKQGYDFWAEPKDRKLPRQILTKVVRTVSGPVFGQIEATIEWQTPEGQRVFTEDRTYTFFVGNHDERMIDLRNRFTFGDMDVKFGDTKESGILSLRLAVTMDEVGVKTPQPLHGQATNSRGGIGAGSTGQCWGRPAEWCDYVGPLDGQTVGVAVFDHPRNFRHPTRWHIRDYGLYTANPFGLAAFTGDKSQDGSHVWKKGESVELNYRVVIHKGDTNAARVADQWKLYSSPPKISLK
ncbi:MAG: PmoA family protein [Planctomycetes bacterium]|nr:PmoA family protein [Planctomycetota bacterium]